MRIEHDVSAGDLGELARERALALSIYVPSDPTDSGHARGALKSAVDQLLRDYRDSGASAAEEDALRQHWRDIDESDLWYSLSRSLAVFIDADSAVVYVLHNALDESATAGRWFNLAPLMRAVFSPQEAYALTLSTDGWQLWHATASSRVSEVGVDPEHPSDAAEATNRATLRDRGHVRRLVGDEGRNLLLEKYATRVNDAVESELHDARDVPLFVFGAQPLIDMFLAHERQRPVVAVHGAADELRADQIDDVIREGLHALNLERTKDEIERIADGTAQGLVATDPAEVARAAVAGAVDVLVYDFTADLQGELDEETGAIEHEDEGHDLLSQVAIAVLTRGGTLVPERPDDVGGFIDESPFVARLRYALT